MQIFPNGTMTYADPTVTPQSDLDENGLPVAVSSDVEKKSVGCTISTLSENRKGIYDDGINSVRSVSLTHDIKGDFGTFQVQRIEFYTITQTVEIWL